MISKQEHEHVRELTRLSVSTLETPYAGYSELDILADVCCKFFDVSITEFKSMSRKRQYAECRHLFFFIAKNYCNKNYTLGAIADFTGGRHHSTVIHGVNSIYDRMDVENDLPKLCSNVLNEFNRVNRWA